MAGTANRAAGALACLSVESQWRVAALAHKPKTLPPKALLYGVMVCIEGKGCIFEARKQHVCCRTGSKLFFVSNSGSGKFRTFFRTTRKEARGGGGGQVISGPLRLLCFAVCNGHFKTMPRFWEGIVRRVLELSRKHLEPNVGGRRSRMDVCPRVASRSSTTRR